jgi:hypothetical protein
MSLGAIISAPDSACERASFANNSSVLSLLILPFSTIPQ